MENHLMIRPFLAAALSIALASCASTEVPAAPRSAAPAPVSPDTIEILVLGTYHFHNPGLDIINPASDNVLAPSRQAELEELSKRLAAFRPTAIAVESVPRGDTLADTGFARFTRDQLATDPNEIVQIGYRLADDVGINRVYSVDVQQGELPFFPFDRIRTYAEREGRSSEVDEMIAEAGAVIDHVMRDLETTPVYEVLARYNEAGYATFQQTDFYYRILGFSDMADPAGAMLNTGWYARNAIIFANILSVAEPGDRILVIYGSGHNYWLRHFAEMSPGITLVDPLPYLTGQATASATANGS